MLHFFAVALFSGCTFSILHFFRLILFSCCTFLRVVLFSSCIFFHSFHDALFSCYTLFVLHFFRVAVFSGCTLFMLLLFRVAHFLSCTFSIRVTLFFILRSFHLFMLHFFPYCLLFILNVFSQCTVAIFFVFFWCFSCCTFFVLHYLNVTVFSSCTIFMFYFFHIVAFSSWTFFVVHFFALFWTFTFDLFPVLVVFLPFFFLLLFLTLHTFHIVIFHVAIISCCSFSLKRISHMVLFSHYTFPECGNGCYTKIALNQSSWSSCTLSVFRSISLWWIKAISYDLELRTLWVVPSRKCHAKI